MAGLAGVVDSQAGGAFLESLLRDMCKSITHEDWYQAFRYSDDMVGLGRVSLNILAPEPQPIFNRDQSLCILMDGEIYNYEELRQRFAVPQGALVVGNDPELLLCLYEACGPSFVTKVNGSFSLAIWDKTERRLTVINDRYGLRPVYYSQANSRLTFASEVKAILQDPTVGHTIDDRGVADFVTFQTVFGSKTLFEDIRVLPPASIMIYHNGALSLQQYWDFEFRDDSEELPEEAYMDDLGFLIRQAVARRMQGTCSKGVFLSGGLDSRVLIAAIDREHHPIHSFTQGTPTCNDVRFARRIAASVGSMHHYISFPPDFLSSYAERGTWLTDGMMSSDHMSCLNILPFAREHCQVALDGMGADDLIGGDYIKREHFADGVDNEQLIQLFYKRYAQFPEASRSPFSEEYRSRIDGAAYESIREAFETAPRIHPANRNEYVGLKSRQRRYILFGPVLARSELECRTPFYDNDLVDYLHTIPPRVKLGKHFYVRFVSRSFPDVAKIPWSFSGIPVASSTAPRLFMRRAMYAVRRDLRNRVYRATSGRVILPHDGRDFKDYRVWLRTHLKGWARDVLLGPRALERGYFDGNTIRLLLDEHMSGVQDHTSRICTLLTFELWHRQFIDRVRPIS